DTALSRRRHRFESGWGRHIKHAVTEFLVRANWPNTRNRTRNRNGHRPAGMVDIGPPINGAHGPAPIQADHRSMGYTPIIPTCLAFADLDLQRSPVTQNLLFAPAALAEVCRCSGLDPVALLGDEDLACSLICAWDVAHRLAGGEPDPVVTQIVVERNAAQASGIAALLEGGRQARL
ncbi:MAG: hypothetical protein ACMG6H_12405, partial [Acidobacteriota bacterium]